MKKLYIIVIMIIVSAISIIGTMMVVDSSETPSSYKKHSIDSKILKENREIIVKLPDGYSLSSNQRYTVV